MTDNPRTSPQASEKIELSSDVHQGNDQFVGSLAPVAMRSMFWSLIQNWGGRMMNFVQFVILAQFLSPKDFGLAAAAAIITLLITLVSEFGFSDAIIQSPDLDSADVNLPFYTSIVISCLLASIATTISVQVEAWLGVPGLSKIVVALALITPLSTISIFQEAMYKRNLKFKGLAVRVLIANIIATLVSVPCAILGWGVWSLVVQTYLVTGIGAIWLWRRPEWRPGLEIRPSTFFKLIRFGVSILAMRLLDFGATRMVEVLMIGRYGVRAYGFYTASAKLNQTLMDLLQAALNDVSLTLLSKISTQRERLAAVYRTSITVAGNIVPPVFIAVAVLSPEICRLLFDPRWNGIEKAALPLFILGAVQSLQFFSRPYLNARGRSEIVLVISIAKFLLIAGALYLAPSGDIYSLITYFVIAQLLSAPISFAVTARELKVPYLQIYKDLAPVAVAAGMAFYSVLASRWWVNANISIRPVFAGLVLGFVFLFTYLTVILCIGRRQLRTVIDFATSRIKERKRA